MNKEMHSTVNVVQKQKKQKSMFAKHKNPINMVNKPDFDITKPYKQRSCA